LEGYQSENQAVVTTSPEIDVGMIYSPQACGSACSYRIQGYTQTGSLVADWSAEPCENGNDKSVKKKVSQEKWLQRQ